MNNDPSTWSTDGGETPVDPKFKAEVLDNIERRNALEVAYYKFVATEPGTPEEAAAWNELVDAVFAGVNSPGP